MAWSKVYTGGTGGGSANYDFLVYFFDTYLAGKPGWSVGAHPDGSAYKRKMNFTADNIVTGSTHTTYWWFNWFSTSGSSNTIWYLDGTYTTSPGDLCTYTSTSNLASAQTGEWTIWESGINNNEFMVYSGRKPWLYWPAVNKVMAWDDGLWDGTGTTVRGRTGLWPGGEQGSQYANPSFVGGSFNSSTEYYLVPDCGFDSSPTKNTAAGGQWPILFEGVQWMATPYSTTSMSGTSVDSYPVISRGPSDTAFKYGGENGNTTGDYRWFSTNSKLANVLQDTSTGKWYLHHNSSITGNCIVFDCGLTEPILNA